MAPCCLRAGYCRAGKLQQAWELFTSAEAVQQEPHSYATYQGLITCAVKVPVRASGLDSPGSLIHGLSFSRLCTLPQSVNSPAGGCTALSSLLAGVKPRSMPHQEGHVAGW